MIKIAVYVPQNGVIEAITLPIVCSKPPMIFLVMEGKPQGSKCNTLG